MFLREGLIRSAWITLLILILNLRFSSSITFDSYDDALISYNNGKWSECYDYFLLTLNDYESYTRLKEKCNTKCFSIFENGIHGFQNANDFINSVNADYCIDDCLVAFNSSLKRNRKAVSFVKSYEIYFYLQFCAFKVGNIQNAIFFANTFLQKYPDHEVMQSNLKFFKNLPDAASFSYKTSQIENFLIHYEEGEQFYRNKLWEKAIESMENGLAAFYDYVKDCQLSCIADSDYFSGGQLEPIFRCIIDCSFSELESGRPQKLPNEYFNYLQFSYFKLGNYKKAVSSVASYLRLNPNDEVMKNNAEFYLTVNDITSDDFIVSDEIESMMKIMEQSEFILESQVINEENKVNIVSSRTFPKPVYLPKDESYQEEFRELDKNGIKVAFHDEQLMGKNRVVLDGLLNDQQCQDLMDLVKETGLQGDGYPSGNKRSSPHTDFEKFEGLTLVNGVQAAKSGKTSIDKVKLYLDISELSKTLLNTYYNMKDPLQFHYVHLVCRTALNDQNGRVDLSHPIHSDNCMIKDGGKTCLKEPPAYVDRDFSSLLYLNEDFEGGDFFFANANLTVQKTVKSKCGRLVGFEAHNYHGVLPVTGGRRCALAIWYTINQKEKDYTHFHSLNSLKYYEDNLRKIEILNLKKIPSLKDIEIISESADLNGPERFVAENLISEKECEMLKDLADVAATLGDGYGEKGNPHTQHEIYAGLTIKNAGLLLRKDPSKVDLVKLYLDVAERGRLLTEKYFLLKNGLYTDYVHLVKRTPIDVETTARNDLSHSIHSDNCIMHNDGTCKKVRPAYIQRDYSAIVFLNSEFNGGEFFFAHHHNYSVSSQVTPACGRIVAFNAGNYHGVKAVLKGIRYALAEWFTLDAEYKTQEHNQIGLNIKEIEMRKKDEF